MCCEDLGGTCLAVPGGRTLQTTTGSSWWLMVLQVFFSLTDWSLPALSSTGMKKRQPPLKTYCFSPPFHLSFLSCTQSFEWWCKCSILLSILDGLTPATLKRPCSSHVIPSPRLLYFTLASSLPIYISSIEFHPLNCASIIKVDCLKINQKVRRTLYSAKLPKCCRDIPDSRALTPKTSSVVKGGEAIKDITRSTGKIEYRW